MGIDIYIERDPTKDPALGCPKPLSTANFKCTLFGPAVTAESAVNDGSYEPPADSNRTEFHVIIRSLNGKASFNFANLYYFLSQPHPSSPLVIALFNKY